LNPVPLIGTGAAAADKGKDGDAGGDAMQDRFGAVRGARGDDGRRLEEEWLLRVITIVAGFDREKS